MRSLTTEQKAVGKWAGYHTCYPKRRDGCWGSCPGGLCGAWFVPCGESCLWTPICPICCFPCCCYCERAPDTGAFVQRGRYGEYQGEYLLLDHERGTIGCYAAVCCTNRLNAEPDCYCVRRGAPSA